MISEPSWEDTVKLLLQSHKILLLEMFPLRSSCHTVNSPSHMKRPCVGTLVTVQVFESLSPATRHVNEEASSQHSATQIIPSLLNIPR